MTKIKFLMALLLLGLLNSHLEAQTDKVNIAKINVVSPFFGSLHLAYERVFSDKLSAQVSFFYTGRRDRAEVNGGVGFIGEARFYLSDNNSAPLGFFIAPYLSYQAMKQNIEIANPQGGDNLRSKANLNMFSVGLTAGYQWIFKDIITVDVWGGPGFVVGSQSPEASDDIKVNKPPFPYTKRTGLGGRLGATIGVAF
ncbi:MAG: DUF3575 domain-containing protein [Microscillaceae bacterium]|jgi:hypothetical protein|nr:DUF3575 domain-containing protein [Microscillaceae bacterium]